MERILTIRLGTGQDQALTVRARALGKTKSELVRDLIEQAVTDEPLGRRARRLKGRLQLPRPTSGWRRTLRDRNWR
ncbi:MAG: ribbon-helix-helix protein, CopG family [Acidobacteria bacterium]|nr:ribbon-helix-helix protein, CopG family [Acidobacteriota bacterium]